VSVRFLPLAPGHVMAIQLQAAQVVEAGITTDDVTYEHARELAEQGSAWAALRGDEVICCAGIRETFAGRQGLAWAMLTDGLGVAAHLAVTRFARARIAECPLVRVECLIADDPANRGGKWADAVGMPREATLRKWGAASETIHVHARIR